MGVLFTVDKVRLHPAVAGKASQVNGVTISTEEWALLRDLAETSNAGNVNPNGTLVCDCPGCRLAAIVDLAEYVK